MANQKSRVSVIIPTYNRAHFIAECLESVLNQTCGDYEVILIDDGSTDDTEAVIKPYLDRIRYIKQENQGNAGARNSGVELAKGEILAFNDSDDLWLPDKLEKQINYLDEHPQVDMVCGNGLFFGSHKLEGKPVIPFKRAVPLERDGVSLASIFMKSSLRTPTMVVRRKVFHKVGGFDPDFKVCVDLDFAFRVLMHFNVAFMNEPLFKLRKHDGHVGGDSERRTLYNIRAIEKLLRDYAEAKDLIGEENIKRRISYRYCRLGSIYGRKGRKKDALDAFKKALAYRPFYPSCMIKYLRFKFS
ncbi:MAG: glycosyltransferase [Deltaproteobacteria bacterium]|nr:glycosyltransferase [Deltaproteobacteria bacterium]